MTTEQQFLIRMLLWEFAAFDNWRGAMNGPYLVGDFTYACDGRRLIEIPGNHVAGSPVIYRESLATDFRINTPGILKHFPVNDESFFAAPQVICGEKVDADFDFSRDWQVVEINGRKFAGNLLWPLAACQAEIAHDETMDKLWFRIPTINARGCVMAIAKE